MGKSRFRRMAAAGLCTALLLSVSGCQENPEGSIVVHKNMENLISEAETPTGDKVDAAGIREEVKNKEQYTAEIEDENLRVTVHADAEVLLPETDTLSVYRVRQKPFDAAFVETVRRALLGDEPLYDASVYTARTKKEIEEEIAEGRKNLAQYEAEIRAETDENGDPLYTEEEIEQDVDVMEYDYVGRLQEEYEQAPDSVVFSDYAIDGTLQPVSDLYAENPQRYAYYNELIPEGHLLDAVTDGGDGLYKAFKVIDSEHYSNWMQYASRPDKTPNEANGVVAPNVTLRKGMYFVGGQPQNPNMPENFLETLYGWNEETKFVPFTGDEVTLSEEEARAKSEDFLKTIGLTDFIYDEGGLYSVYASPEDLDGATNTVMYRRYYILHYFRDIDGTPLTQSSGTKYMENDNRKTIWPGECVEFRINDSGIVGFSYDSPVEVTETVVEGAALKPFSEIRDTFESMVCVANADEEETTVITIDRVRLSYSRISEQDAFDTGLIVPVWSFEGKIETAIQNVPVRKTTGTVLAINAIDGSVIDETLGY